MLRFVTTSRSENEHGFLRPGIKTDAKNNIFCSEVESGFEEPGGIPPPRIPRSKTPVAKFQTLASSQLASHIFLSCF